MSDGQYWRQEKFHVLFSIDEISMGDSLMDRIHPIRHSHKKTIRNLKETARSKASVIFDFVDPLSGGVGSNPDDGDKDSLVKLI